MLSMLLRKSLYILAIIFSISQSYATSSRTPINDFDPPFDPNALTNEERVASFKIAAEQGDIEAMLNLARIFSLKAMMTEGNEDKIKENVIESINWYQKSAVLGNTGAMQRLGMIYLSDKNPLKDEKKSFHWFHKAANKGMGFSQFQLSQMYNKGIGTDKNIDLAQHWLKKSEALGYGSDFSGKLPIDLTDQSIATVKESANQGSVSSMLFLAWYYSDSDRINITEATKWYEKAAESGSTQAMLQLGSIYSMGKDKSKAFYWYQKAANKGKGIAQKRLAHMYANGIGIDKNLKKSKFWLDKSKTQKFHTFSVD